MPALPPPERPHHHHEIHAGRENLPTSDLRQPERLEIPIAPGLIPGVRAGIELDSGVDSDLDEKPYPRRRFSLRGLHELRGAVMFKLTIMFFIRSVHMNSKSVITWFRQPTTLAGLATAFGILSSVFGGAMTWQHAIGPLVAAVFAILVPDNTSTILHQSQANGLALGAPVPAPAVVGK